MRKKDKERLKYGLSLIPLGLIVFFILFIPIISVVIGSFKEDGTNLYTLSNYTYILKSKFYRQSFFNSLRLSFISSILGILISFQLSYSISRLEQRIKNVVLLYSNMMSNFSGLPLAFAFIIILGVNGAVTLILKEMGITDFNIYSQKGLILVYTYFQIPLGTLLLYTAFDSLDERWKEACSLLGGNKKDFWRYIGLPILKSPIFGTLIILFTNAMGAYATAYGIMTSNYNIIPIRIGALISGDVVLKPNLASTLAVFLVVTILFIFFINEKFIQKKKY